MKITADTITVNGTEYVPKDSVKQIAKRKDGMDYVICRTYSAGVFAGYLEKREGKEVVLREARRLWYWSGASSLSQLAVDGVKKPDECKFPVAVDKVELTEAIEILTCTEEAKNIILTVPVWKQ